MAENGKRTALILGITGGVGQAAAAALAGRGWTIRAMSRKPAADTSIQWMRGDAMNRSDVLAAAEGVQVIVHGVNPPGYRNWAKLVVPMIDNTIAAAEASGARIAFPGTVYNFGPDAGAVVSETSSQNPKTRKGKLRVVMEQHLAEAAKVGRAQTVIVRAGDYFGPQSRNNWLSQGLIKPGKPVRAITYPGPHKIGHSWAYLPDVGETFAALLDRQEVLKPFDVFHMQGQWLDPGIEMAHAIRLAAGSDDIPVRQLPWGLLRLIAPFNETLREMMEMRYLWQKPLRLENTKLRAFLGQEPHTPLVEAVSTTLKACGSL